MPLDSIICHLWRLSTLMAAEADGISDDIAALSGLPEGRLSRVKVRNKYYWKHVTYNNRKRSLNGEGKIVHNEENKIPGPSAYITVPENPGI